MDAAVLYRNPSNYITDSVIRFPETYRDISPSRRFKERTRSLFKEINSIRDWSTDSLAEI